MVFRQIFTSADHHPPRIRKTDKLFGDEFNFADVKLPLKTKDIQKVEKKNSINISFFGYENKEKDPIYLSKNVLKKNMLIY